MIAIIDVDYKDPIANVACLVFKSWEDEIWVNQYTCQCSDIAAYVPGEFYKRELPCILAVLKLVKEEITSIVIDGYVWLNKDMKPGLGVYLYESLHKEIPVIGIAKKSFFGMDNTMSRAIIRGTSKRPLYVTSIGIDLDFAGQKVQNMQSVFRHPDKAKKVDQLCRAWT